MAATERNIKLVKKAEREKKLAPETDLCVKIPVDELRALLQDVRRRLNTIDEKLEQACEMIKQ